MKVRFGHEAAIDIDVPLKCAEGVTTGQAFRNHRRVALEAGFEAIRRSDYRPNPEGIGVGLGGCSRTCGIVGLASAENGVVTDIIVAPVDELV